MKKLTASVFALLFGVISFAQSYELKNTVEIYKDIQKLQRGLRVLYVAAHPDDENTRLISWLENDQHIETAYLSLTRGQGGQNLIGDEKGDALGVIRTYELLEARKVDGAEQMFTRAIDFGYSKSATESFDFWGKDEVLHDVVYVIRKFRPHVIITRFPPTRRAGHGHHEASAILAEEAFDMAGDPKAYPDQLNTISPWKPIVLYHNTSSWWDKSLETMSDEELLGKKMHRVNIGVYDELSGLGMNEIASMARSKHRCQAFGTPRRRGEQFEFLQYVKGDWSDHFLDSLSGIWHLSEAHPAALAQVLEQYDFTDREANLALLRRYFLPKLAQRNMWAEPGDMQYVQSRFEALKNDMAGLRVEVYAGEYPIVVNSAYDVTVEVYNSSNQTYKVEFKHESIDTVLTAKPHTSYTWQEVLKAPSETSTPFWLRKKYQGWLYNIDKRTEIGLPMKTDEQVAYMYKLEGQYVRASTELHRRWNDRSVGEMVEPMQFVNPVSIEPSISNTIVRNGESLELVLKVEAFEDIDNVLPSARSEAYEVGIANETMTLKRGQARYLPVTLTQKGKDEGSKVIFAAQASGAQFGQSRQLIKYDHIPEIAIHKPAITRIKQLDLSFNQDLKIGYIPGSGDEIMSSLQNLGYDVNEIHLNEIDDSTLASYGTIITGIRAYNRNDELASNHDRLMDYVSSGGNVISMYCTTYDLKVQNVGPYKLELSRNRVTDEKSDVKMLTPTHPIFTQPNAIAAIDWTGWVQERGLYFAGEWDEKYTPLIEWNDEGEEGLQGGLLVTSYGNGTFIYSGVSFFRQLPAGVPGAYKLLVNMIEYKP